MHYMMVQVVPFGFHHHYLVFLLKGVVVVVAVVVAVVVVAVVVVVVVRSQIAHECLKAIYEKQQRRWKWK